MKAFGNGFVVTPWEVEGEVDYEKLLAYFGVDRITDEMLGRVERLVGDVHPFLRRQIFYAHRDFNVALDEYSSGGRFFLYTGIAPSKGPMHFGHLVPFLFTRWLQKAFNVNLYIMVPDEEKYLAKKVDSLRAVDERVADVERIISALGFDPDRTFLFRDREYIAHLYDAAVVVARRINYSVARAVFGFRGDTSIGLVFYPALQIVPTLFERSRSVIPCAIDQDPYWRIQRDIAEKIGYKKASTILSKFMPGLDGPSGKMSASKPDSTIFVTDDPETVRRKIMNAYTSGQPTVAEQREKGGNPDTCSVYKWHSLFTPDDEELVDIFSDCRAGNLLCGDCKLRLLKRVQGVLDEIRENQKNAERNLKMIKYEGELATRMWDWKFEYD
ncbi:MAG TPA: tryptophan--tRNA ligase [Euryarchaeota archaeon]|nr:tryptophan--tRNA ligase [Euryarchaeota archaeon]